MSCRRIVVPLTVAALGLVASEARAHDLTGHVSAGGVDFIETQVPSYVPSRLEPGPITETLFTCPGGRPVIATQYDTEVDVDVHDVDLSLPSRDVIRLDITLSVLGEGKAYLENPFVCYGETTCDDVMSIDHGRAIVDFAVSASGGEPQVSVSAVELALGPDDVDLTLSGCAVDDIVNWVVDFGKEWFLDYVLTQIEDTAVESLTPLLQEMVGGVTTFEGNLGVADFSAALEDIDVDAGGVTAAADADLTSPLPPVACVGDDPGEPAAREGSAPDLAAGGPAHMGVSVNLGLVDDALYHAWASGLTCTSSEELEARGIVLHLDHLALLFPELPAGTELSLDAHLAEPPRVIGGTRSSAELAVVIEGAVIELVARAPDGTRRSLRIDLDASATGRIGLEPGINALTLEMLGASLDRLDVTDELGAADVGFDAARIAQVLEDAVLPALFEELAQIPITGPVFGLADYYLILRDLGANSSHLWAKADLFRAPADDRTAPTTEIVRQPGGVANPENALVLVSGADDEVPTELLQYRVTVDGETRPLTFVQQIEIGRAGVTDTYEVRVAAVDLAGNADPIGASTEVTVDGETPGVSIHGDRMRHAPDPGVELTWSMSDDYTDSAALRPRVEVYRLVDDTDSLTGEPVETIDLDPGATSGGVELEPGELYRVEVVVADEAGNQTRSSAMVRVTAGGGCSASGRGAPAGLVLVLLVGLLACRPRWPTSA